MEQSADFSRYHIFVFRSLEHLSFVVGGYLTTNSLRRSVVWALEALTDKLHQGCVLVFFFELRASLGKFELCQNDFEIFWLWLFRNFLSSSSCRFFLEPGCRELVLLSHDFSHSWWNFWFFREESIDNFKLLVLLSQGRKLLLEIVNSCQEWGFDFIDILLGKSFCLLLTTSHIKNHKWWRTSTLSWTFVVQILYFFLQNVHLLFKKLFLFYLFIHVLDLLFLPFTTLL